MQWQFGRTSTTSSSRTAIPRSARSRIVGHGDRVPLAVALHRRHLGQNIRTGAQLRVGFPLPRSSLPRVSVSYGAESATFTQGLLGRLRARATASGRASGFDCTSTRGSTCRSRTGSLRTITANFNGGPLGGTVTFQRYTGEMRSYALLGAIGGKRPGSQPLHVRRSGCRAKPACCSATPGRSSSSSSSRSVACSSARRCAATRSSRSRRRLQPEHGPVPVGPGVVRQRLHDGERRDGAALQPDARTSTCSSTPATSGRPRGISTRRGCSVRPGRCLNRDAARSARARLAYGFDRVAVDPATLRVRPDPRWQFHFRLGQLF